MVSKNCLSLSWRQFQREVQNLFYWWTSMVNAYLLFSQFQLYEDSIINFHRLIWSDSSTDLKNLLLKVKVHYKWQTSDVSNAHVCSFFWSYTSTELSEKCLLGSTFLFQAKWHTGTPALYMTQTFLCTFCIMMSKLNMVNILSLVDYSCKLHLIL
jgi:hypothetical protein